MRVKAYEKIDKSNLLENSLICQIHYRVID
jgi:hypothetical protein